MREVSEQIKKNREYMHCPSFLDVMANSDQRRGLPHPAHGKKPTGRIIQLPPFEAAVVNPNFVNLLDARRSVRAYDKSKAMSQEQLAFMLYSANGVQSYRDDAAVHTLRTVPSGGARHPFEVYMVVRDVAGLQQGLYHYLPMEHMGEKRVAIEYLNDFTSFDDMLVKMCVGQDWVMDAHVTFFISCVPYRGEWRYMELSHRVMLTDLGFIGQNLMLSAVGGGLGSCCMAGYSQELCDKAFGLDGFDEYMVMAVAAGAPLV